MKLQCLCLWTGSLARSSFVRLHGIGGNNQEESLGGWNIDVSGLVAGVEIGVTSAVLGGGGEQVVCDVGLGGVSSLVVDDIELFSSVSAMLSVLPFSTP